MGRKEFLDKASPPFSHSLRQGGDFDWSWPDGGAFPAYKAIQSQIPHPFDFAQGRLCRTNRDKGRATGPLPDPPHLLRSLAAC
jgi:hypothetical protein